MRTPSSMEMRIGSEVAAEHGRGFGSKGVILPSECSPVLRREFTDDEFGFWRRRCQDRAAEIREEFRAMRLDYVARLESACSE